MKWLYGAMLLLLSATSQALCDDRLAFHTGGWSKHFISRGEGKPEWNEKHHVKMLDCNRWSIASFINSKDEEAVGIAHNYFMSPHKRYDWSLYVGLWSGYEEGVTGAGVIPVIAPRFNINLGHLEVSTYVTPIVAFVTVGVEW